MKIFSLALLLAMVAAPLAGQDIRLEGRVSPEIAALVQELATSAAARGLPVDPLIQKAIEGAAKGVPADRVATALRALDAQLAAADAALRQAGAVQPDTTAIAAAAFALNAGLSDEQVTELARMSRAPYGVTTTLRVASTLAAMGVPAAETVRLVTQVIEAGGSPNEVLGLPAAVMARGPRGNSAAARANAPGQNKIKPKPRKP